MTDDNTPTCKAQYTLNHGGPWDCVLSENHSGQHQDRDGDSWDITYRDAPVKPLGDRVDHLLVGNLSRRVGELEAAWTVGGETLSERLDRNVLGIVDHVHDVANRVSALALRTNDLQGLSLTLREDNSRLHTRITELESRLNPVCGHRDPSSGRACQKSPGHSGQVHRDMIPVHDGIAWSTDHSSAEHQANHLTPATHD